MIRNKDSQQKFIYAFVTALIVHAAIFSLVKTPLNDIGTLLDLSNQTKNLKQPIKLDEIKLIDPSEIEKLRKVGIKNGQKNLQRPDIAPKPTIKTPVQKGQPNPLSMEKLAPVLPKPRPVKVTEALKIPLKKEPNNDSGGNFFFSYKNNKVIEQSQEQEIIKSEAQKKFTVPQNKATDRISNFEIRYERPEGVSEDELNSDEKAYYSFYVRSYQNYFSKIYANYEKIVIERPGLAGVFDKKHLLIGKIDYDEQGNIVTVRILKSAENDDLHYFFEETLKQLSQPNPPKIFTKNRKQFSIYYQLQIN